MKPDSEQTWDFVAFFAAAALGTVTRAALKRGWSATLAQDPPENPAAPGTTWPSALAWGALTGMTVGVARVVARRVAAGGWRAAAGERPSF